MTSGLTCGHGVFRGSAKLDLLLNLSNYCRNKFLCFVLDLRNLEANNDLWAEDG